MSYIKYFLKTAIVIVVLLSIQNISNAQVKSYQKTPQGVSFNLAVGKMNIYLIKDDLVEVKYTSLKELENKQSLVVEIEETLKRGGAAAGRVRDEALLVCFHNTARDGFPRRNITLNPSHLQTVTGLKI